jgi:hypothetical protein
MVDQNLQVKLANDEAKLAQAELLGTRAMYLPNVNAFLGSKEWWKSLFV